jgi:hypothetical protein
VQSVVRFLSEFANEVVGLSVKKKNPKAAGEKDARRRKMYIVRILFIHCTFFSM